MGTHARTLTNGDCSWDEWILHDFATVLQLQAWLSLINMQSWKRWLNKSRTHQFFCKFGALLSLLLQANCHVFHRVLTAWKRLGTPDIQQGCSMLQSRLWINASTWLLWRVLFSLAFSLETKYQMALTNTTTEVTWTAILESRWCRWRSLSYRATDTVRGRLQSIFVPFRSCWSLWWYFCRKATNKSLQALQERVARNEEKSEQEVPCC